MKVSKTQGGQHIGKMAENSIVLGGLRELNGATVLQRLNCSVVNYGSKGIVVVGSVDIISKVIDAIHDIRAQGKPRNLFFLGTHNLGQIDPDLNERSKGSRHIRRRRRSLLKILTDVNNAVAATCVLMDLFGMV